MSYIAKVNFKAGPGKIINTGDVYQGERLQEFIAAGFLVETEDKETIQQYDPPKKFFKKKAK